MEKFLSELKRRNVLRVAAFYAAAGWLLVQIATQVLPVFDVPTWAMRVVVVAVVLGFPFALVFSWFYELTPEGLKRENEVNRSQSIARSTGRKLDRWIIGVLAAAVVALLANQFVPHKDLHDTALGKAIAVLPPVNDTGDPNNEYFSDGLSEELCASQPGARASPSILYEPWMAQTSGRGSTTAPCRISSRCRRRSRNPWPGHSR
jgi:hypothetical protein